MPLRHEGKVLGLAAYGDGQPLLQPFSRALRLVDQTRLASDFVGTERPEEARKDFLRSAIAGHSRETVAAATQQTFEGVILPLVRNFVAETGLRRLALNGGASPTSSSTSGWRLCPRWTKCSCSRACPIPATASGRAC